MNKVITISLNKNAYQFEEPGFHALHAYLERAGNKLFENPDKEEIMADLEQAIADKCTAYLSATKTVITQQETESILAAMGPVEDWNSTEDQSHEPQSAPRRLYKIREGAVFEGVCNGIAVYLNLDVTVVRVLFIILAIATAGTWVIAYILMAIFIPEARTSADRAAANGKPFNTQTIVDEAHKRYQDLKAYGKEQKQKWEAKEAADRAQWAAKEAKIKEAVQPIAEPPAERPGAGSRFARGVAGILGATGSLVLVALSIAWIVALVDVFTKGTVFGYFGGAATPALALFISCVFYLIFLPLQAVVGDAFRYAKNVQGFGPSFWGRMFTALLWIGLVGVIGFIVQQSQPIRDGLKDVRADVEQQLNK
ncbi:MAG TPA: PspC domain-containing protein [Candidatus Saccharimonadales bacterium]|nr:PspC domain-containing protein [Candidatus Saccharimonadales bacterium]